MVKFDLARSWVDPEYAAKVQEELKEAQSMSMFELHDVVEVTWTDEEDRYHGIKEGDKGIITSVPSVGAVVVDLEGHPIERYMERGQLKVIERNGLTSAE